MNRTNVIAWLSGMSHKQFAEFFYDAVAKRITSDFKEEEGHFVLADTSQFPCEGRETDFIALPDTAKYDHDWVWADDSPICQSGDCLGCGSVVRSIAKHAICPLCYEEVYCT